MKYRYYWATFKEKTWSRDATIVEVEQDRGGLNCLVIGSDACFREADFDFLEEIKPYREESQP